LRRGTTAQLAASAVEHQHVPVARPGHRGAQQRRLSDTRRSLDEHQRSVARGSRLQRIVDHSELLGPFSSS
jgi:hypothetical protein